MSLKATTYSTTKLTPELRELVENGIDIWAFDYDGFYEGEAKAAFEKKVVDHYYFRQIGQETIGRFLHYFRARVREIMPYYKQLYKTIQIMDAIEDPFGNIDVTETFEQTSTNRGSSSGKVDSSTTSSGDTSVDTSDEHTNRFSDSPAGAISNIDNYLTTAARDNTTGSTDTTMNNESTSESSSESESENESTVRHTFRKIGNQGVNTYAHDMVEFRQTLLNIDAMFINDLNDLFLRVY